jgi:ABC-type nickel/cobalt efflux system permease component RcnA
MAGIAIVCAAAPAGAASVPAHPVGNETINQSVNLRVQPDHVLIDYVLDVAELPAYSLCKQQFGSAGCNPDPSQATRMAREECDYDAGLMRLELPDGHKPVFRSTASAVVFLAGSGGLSTLRLTCAFVADVDLRGETLLSFSNDAYYDTIGVREVTAVGDGATLVRSDVGRVSPTQRLTTFPTSVLRNPPDVREARLLVRPGGPRLAGTTTTAQGNGGATRIEGGRVDALSRAFTGLVDHRRLTALFAFGALVVAIGLGAAHAVAPGHGKTMMAAYLVAEHGSLRQAAAVGLTVTATHTLGVLVLGVVLSASTTVAPSQLYPWLGLASGLLVVAVGAGLVRRAWRSRGHSHGDSHHPHGDHHGTDSHDRHRHGGSHHGNRTRPDPHDRHPHGDSHPQPDDRAGLPGLRSLLGMGIAGGLAPSPSAVVVLLGGIAIGRPWFGVLLVVAYGVGMALTLTAAGFALVRVRDAVARRGRSIRFPRLLHALPRITAVAVVVIGVVIAARSGLALLT